MFKSFPLNTIRMIEYIQAWHRNIQIRIRLSLQTLHRIPSDTCEHRPVFPTFFYHESGWIALAIFGDTSLQFSVRDLQFSVIQLQFSVIQTGWSTQLRNAPFRPLAIFGDTICNFQWDFIPIPNALMLHVANICLDSSSGLASITKIAREGESGE